jgi:DNA (cytosine-5)-methyltransferase 1
MAASPDIPDIVEHHLAIWELNRRRRSELSESRKAKTYTAENAYIDRLEGRLLRRRKRYQVIDAFCGAGGMTLGFSAAMGHPFVPVWANDTDEACAQTYTANFGVHCEVAEITSLLRRNPEHVPAADVVIGGPPCQPHCPLNKYRDGDPRKQLWRPFLDIVVKSGASIFVIENLPQLISSSSFEYGEIVEHARVMGFRVAAIKLCAADFGVPQTRWRAFIIGWQAGDPWEFFPPKATHRNPNQNNGHSRYKMQYEYGPRPQPWVTVKDAIEDLPSPVGTQIRTCPPPLNLHVGRDPTAKSKARYQAIPEEGMNRFDLQRNAPEITPQCWLRKPTGGTDLFGRLWWDRPAVTIRTEFFKPEKGRYLHPVEHRPITHREAARFQSFPDSFLFLGSKAAIARQIGNAVPPLLAARVADCVYAMLKAAH